MSDAAITTVVTGMVTIVATIVTFLTLWLKLRYNATKAEEAVVSAQRVEGKLDHNTIVSTEAKDAAKMVLEHTTTCDSDRKALFEVVGKHDERIGVLERQMLTLTAQMDVVTKSIDSTRHEMRGHLQTVTNKLDLIMTMKSNTLEKDK